MPLHARVFFFFFFEITYYTPPPKALCCVSSGSPPFSSMLCFLNKHSVQTSAVFMFVLPLVILISSRRADLLFTHYTTLFP